MTLAYDQAADIAASEVPVCVRVKWENRLKLKGPHRALDKPDIMVFHLDLSGTEGGLTTTIAFDCREFKENPGKIADLCFARAEQGVSDIIDLAIANGQKISNQQRRWTFRFLNRIFKWGLPPKDEDA